MKTGYWFYEDPCEALQKIPLERPLQSADVFLHGFCGIFALALHDLFGYELCWLLDDEAYEEEDSEPWRHLVHIYCRAEDEKQKLLIDIRGITTDDEAFFDEFRDFFTEGYFLERLDAEVIKDNLFQDMTEEEYNFAYSCAVQLIRDGANEYKTDRKTVIKSDEADKH